MSSGLFLSMIVLLAALAWGVLVFNRFIALRNRYQNAYAQIDVQLKRRYDLIPNLVAATKAYLAHERETLEAVIAARQRASDANQAARQRPHDGHALVALEAAETALASPLARLMALVEQYPALQADDTVQRLTEELRTTENRIAFARQAFNDQVMGYNIELESFPASLVATLCGFRRASMLRATASAQERHAVPVAL
ncbi:MAG: LemA family protein [Burkholderiaceae bacterium]|nr:LemA family protein [Burkholderiaceae bacterium]MEB2351738.1 LemA family protein [Burkholderiaceae bacterium]